MENGLAATIFILPAAPQENVMGWDNAQRMAALALLAVTGVLLAGCGSAGTHVPPSTSPPGESSAPGTLVPPMQPAPLRSGTTASYLLSFDNQSSSPFAFQILIGNQSRQLRKDGSLVNAYEIRQNRSLQWTFGVGLQREHLAPKQPALPGISNYFARDWPEFLNSYPDAPREEATVGDYFARSHWFPDSYSPAYLPPVDGYLYSFLPTLHWGFRNSSGSINGHPTTQSIASNPNFTHVSIISLPATIGSDEWGESMGVRVESVYRGLSVPSAVTMSMFQVASNGSEEPGPSWRETLADYREGQGNVLDLGADSAPPLLPAAATSALETTKALAGADVVHPAAPTKPLGFFNFTDSFGAALQTPQLVQWQTDHPKSALFSAFWQRGTNVAVNGNAANPGDLVVAHWDFDFGALPVPPKQFQQAPRVAVDERATNGHWVKPETGQFSSDSTTTVFSTAGMTSLAKRALVDVEHALEMGERVHGTKSPVDQVLWSVFPTESDAAADQGYTWQIAYGCPFVASGPSTVLAINAKTGFLQYGFLNEDYRAADRCVLGSTPPI